MQPTTPSPESPAKKDWHPALRWLAILPAMIGVFLATTLFGLISTFIFELFGRKSDPDDFSVLPLIYSAVGGYMMVTVAHQLAPAGKRATAIVASVIIVAIGILSLAGREGPMVGYLIDIAMLGGGGFAGLQALRGKEPSMQGL